jgi:glycosyltransferase involved in cell wall biosynthesis
VNRTHDAGRDDLVVVLTYYAPYVSGLTAVARDVAEGLAARGRKVTVVTTRHDDSLPAEEVIGGVRVLRAPVLARLGKGVISPQFARLALRATRHARVANLHLPMLEAGPIARRAHCPVVVTYHCDVSLPAGLVNSAQGKVIDASSRAAMAAASAVVVTSEDYARHSRVWPSIAPRVVAIPPPCRPCAGGTPRYRDGDGLHVGFLGRIVEEKGLEFLVDGFRALGDPKARLLIGGDFAKVAGGSVVDRVRARIDGDERISLLGFVPDEALADFYASLDVFALPSVNAFEAFGIVQVVAMLAGVPVLASDLPGVRVPVQETGMGRIVAPRDVPGITAALRQLRDNPPDRAAGSAAARKLYSVDSVLDAFEALVDKANSDTEFTRGEQR